MRIKEEMLLIINEFDKRAGAAAIKNKITIYIIGAGSLIIEGVITRTTLDLDYIPSAHGNLFQNIITESGIVSHLVPSGLTNMPHQWRTRAVNFGNYKNITVKIPGIHDRLIDKITRGSGSDIDDTVQAISALGNVGVCLKKLEKKLFQIGHTEYRSREEILESFKLIKKRIKP